MSIAAHTSSTLAQRCVRIPAACKHATVPPHRTPWAQDQYRLRLPYFSRRGGGRLRVNDVAGLRHTWESP